MTSPSLFNIKFGRNENKGECKGVMENTGTCGSEFGSLLNKPTLI